MHHRIPIGTLMLAVALGVTMSNARAFDESKYPNWKGQWLRTDTGTPRYDPSKPPGRGQQAPLTPEYQSILEASLADQAGGGQGGDPTYTCLAPGMPRIMNNYEGAEFVITPRTTHVLMEHIHDFRRIYTDGRDWPEDIDPTFAGYSIGKWIDAQGSGRYDALEVETRFLRGPRTWDQSGMPTADDNDGVIKERLYLDKANPNILHDEMTTIDNSLTQPWSAMKSYRRARNVIWAEDSCSEGNPHVFIGKEVYFRGPDGVLMPVKKDQPPPDLKYFNQSRK